MSFLFASVKKDLARWSQDRVAMLVWFGIPFLLGGLITSMMEGGASPTGKLMIADEDDTLLSGFVVGAYSQEQLGELIVVEKVTAEDGEARINDGEASGFLTIPKGFQDAFINETPVTLVLKTNPAQTILPGIIEDVTEVLLDGGFYLQRLMGPEIAQIAGADGFDGTPSDAFVAALSVDIQHKINKIMEKTDPLAIELEIVEPPPAEPRPDYALLFLPGIVLMAVLFASNSLAADYWAERNKCTLRRLVSAPGALWSFVGGKAIAALAMMGFVAGVTLVVGFAYHGVAWSKFVPSLLWVGLGGVGLFAWFAAIQMMFPNNRAANLVTTILLFPLMMAGGSFFPLAALPDWIADLGRLAPNGFIVDRLSVEFTSATAWSIDARSWLTLLAITLGGLAVSTLRLRTGFARR
jgi:hypothetical protein